MKAKRGREGSGAATRVQCSGDEARAATLRVIERYGPQVMRVARRFAASAEDAEDANQRGVEIMLTKAPDIPDLELLPWLKTLVRHEAFALRRRDDRLASDIEEHEYGDGPGDRAAVVSPPTPSEQAERFERLRVGAEALKSLKPQEARALTLLAQGFSYRQICEKTGWTYTKVNRCLAEGRRSFAERVSGIESGAECERLAPKLSAFADGEASPSDAMTLRRHLRGCGACQATLREHRLAPALVGALLPIPLLKHLTWPVQRALDLLDSLKVKLASVVRAPGFESAASTGDVAVAGVSRNLASVGLVKGLAAIGVGAATAGGVIGVGTALHPQGADAARDLRERDAQVESRTSVSAEPDALVAAARNGSWRVRPAAGGCRAEPTTKPVGGSRG